MKLPNFATHLQQDDTHRADAREEERAGRLSGPGRFLHPDSAPTGHVKVGDGDLLLRRASMDHGRNMNSCADLMGSFTLAVSGTRQC